MAELNPPERHPLRHWTYHAYRCAKALDLPMAFIEEARDIVVSALGVEWLEEQFKKPNSPMGFVLPRHPVAQDFVIAGDNQLIEIMELAVYLRSLAGTVGLEEVVRIMKAPEQFEGAMLQLAYAYRFKRNAAIVELEPATEGGRSGDIEVTLDDRNYLVECYVPEFFSSGTRFQEIAEYSAKKMSAVARHHGIDARVRLEFSREPSADERRAMESVVREAIMEAAREGQCSKDIGFVRVDVWNLATFDVDPDFPDPKVSKPESVPAEADAVIGEINVRVANWDDLKDGVTGPERRGSRVLLRWPRRHEQSTEERVKQLAERFSPKLTQVRKQGAARILIGQVREAVDRTEADSRVAEELQRCLLEKHRDVGAVFLTARIWTTRNRFRCQGMVLYGHEHCSVPRRLVDGLNRIDYQEDLIQDWQ